METAGKIKVVFKPDPPSSNGWDYLIVLEWKAPGQQVERAHGYGKTILAAMQAAQRMGAQRQGLMAKHQGCTLPALRALPHPAKIEAEHRTAWGPTLSPQALRKQQAQRRPAGYDLHQIARWF